MAKQLYLEIQESYICVCGWKGTVVARFFKWNPIHLYVFWLDYFATRDMINGILYFESWFMCVCMVFVNEWINKCNGRVKHRNTALYVNLFTQHMNCCNWWFFFHFGHKWQTVASSTTCVKRTRTEFMCGIVIYLYFSDLNVHLCGRTQL